MFTVDLPKSRAIELKMAQRYSRIRKQLAFLARSGWTIRVWALDPYSVCVDGTDNYGDGFHGTIDHGGNLTAELADD